MLELFDVSFDFSKTFYFFDDSFSCSSLTVVKLVMTNFFTGAAVIKGDPKVETNHPC